MEGATGRHTSKGLPLPHIRVLLTAKAAQVTLSPLYREFGILHFGSNILYVTGEREIPSSLHKPLNNQHMAPAIKVPVIFASKF